MLSTCWGLVTVTRHTCMNHKAALQKKMIHLLVLAGFGTGHENWKELMISTEVPL